MIKFIDVSWNLKGFTNSLHLAENAALTLKYHCWDLLRCKVTGFSLKGLNTDFCSWLRCKCIYKSFSYRARTLLRWIFYLILKFIFIFQRCQYCWKEWAQRGCAVGSLANTIWAFQLEPVPAVNALSSTCCQWINCSWLSAVFLVAT